MRKLILGVDGGGTKTEAVLAEVDEQGAPRVLGSAITGPGNVARDQVDALQNIQSAITGAFHDAEVEPRQVDSIALALAGAGKEVMRDRILQLALDIGWATHTRVIPDALAVIAAGSRSMHGIALICGTGSIALAHTRDGHTARAGGLGIEDPGSGYWIGVQAINRTSEDKIHGKSLERLGKRIEEVEIDWPSPGMDMTDMFVGWDTQRRSIASIAQDVFEVATNDPVVAQIIQQAADELVQLVRNIDQSLAEQEPLPLFLAGGVFANQPEFAAGVAAAAGRDHPLIIRRPVLGALNYALTREA